MEVEAEKMVVAGTPQTVHNQWALRASNFATYLQNVCSVCKIYDTHIYVIDIVCIYLDINTHKDILCSTGILGQIF